MKKFIAFILIIAISFIPLTGCGIKSEKTFDVYKDNGALHFQNASVQIEFNTPFLSLSGSSYEMGLQYGVLMKKQIVKVYESLENLEKDVLSYLPLYLRMFSKIILLFVAHKAEKSMPTKYMEEIKGISMGSGIPVRDILFASFIPELYNFSCTSFVKVVNENIIHGRNLDYYFPLIGENPLVIRYKPENRIPYTAIGCVGYPGVFTGMNDAGITISVDAAPLAKPNNEGTAPITFEIRTILSEAKTLSDVDNILNNYKSIKGWMLIVGSENDGTAAVYNIAGNQIKKTLMEHDSIAVTNTFIDEDFAHKYMTLHDAGSASSISRLKEINSSIKQVDSVSTAIDALSNSNFYNYGSVIGAGDVTTNNEGTLQSVVMDPLNNTIYFSSSDMYAGFEEYLSYSINNDTVSIYRIPHYPVAYDEFDEFKQWFKRIELYYLKGDFKAAKNMVKDIKTPNLLQLEGEEMVDEKLHILKNDKSLLSKADYVIKNYPDFIIPYLIKAKIYFARRDYKNAIKLSNETISCAIRYPYYIAEAYEILARSYYNLNDLRHAKMYANISKQMIQSYAISKREIKLLNELNIILNK
jgi:hypothetical protein